MRWTLPIGAASILVLLAAYLGIGLFVADRLSAPDRSAPPEAPRAPGSVGLPYREVGFESTDGVPLAAWWLPPSVDGPQRAAVLVHGWGGSRSDDYIQETAPLYEEAGYGVLMIDLRGHGESGGERRTLGYADLPLLLRDRLPESSGLPRAFNPGAFLAAKLFLGFDPWAVRPREDAARLGGEGVPLLLIHSTADETVPYEHARLFAAANPEAELWTLDGYGHVEAHEHPEYGARLKTFLDSIP